MKAVSLSVMFALAVLAAAVVVTRPPPPAAPLPAIAPPVPPARVLAPGAPRPPMPRPAADGSLHQRVERLLVLGSPHERYLAFGMLAQCAHAVDFDRYLKSLPAGAVGSRLRERYGDGAARIAAACGDLSARQVEQRIELAAAAADDGIPGAASAWIEEGPYGDATALTQRPDDPLVVQWAEQAIARVHAATRRSDTEAIGQFGLLCLNWEMDDVARVRLLVAAAQQSRREEQIRRVLN